MPKSLIGWLTATIFLISSANAETGQSPTINKQGAHSSHTTDELGNFVHPFLGASPELKNIHYPDSRTFSVRLEKKPGPSRHEKAFQNHIARRNSRSNRVIR